VQRTRRHFGHESRPFHRPLVLGRQKVLFKAP
jgi:hypothetical protein